MAKKSKKSKVTGTPDVVKFKGTRLFNVLKGIMSLQEQRVLMSTEYLDESEYTRISRLLHLLGLVSHDLLIEPPHPDPQQTSPDDEADAHPKDYRLHLYHGLASPAPQLFPVGYSVHVIRQARAILEKPSLIANRREYLYREDLRELSDDFLKNLDRRVIEISSFIEVKLKSDFKDGLKSFKAELDRKMRDLDSAWIEFEKFLLREKLRVHKLIFEDVEKLVAIEAEIASVEARLGSASSEEAMDILGPAKSSLETEITQIVGRLITDLFGPSHIRSESVTLAESCLFYGSERIPNSNGGGMVLKAYVELRHLLARKLRLSHDFKTNDKFMRALGNFKSAVEDGAACLDVAETLPRIAGIKSTGFLTKESLLESSPS